MLSEVVMTIFCCSWAFCGSVVSYKCIDTTAVSGISNISVPSKEINVKALSLPLTLELLQTKSTGI